MPLVTFQDVSIGFRGPPLLDGVNCQIEQGQRIGLLGRNGAGKTTLMRLIAGEASPDTGRVVIEPNVKVAWLPQDVPHDLAGTLFDITMAGIPAHSYDESTRWEAEHQVQQTLDRMELTPDAEFSSLSSGMKRRVLLARAIACQPDLLLLDEPTNHLDISAIAWLEQFLDRWQGALLFVTHDRMFLRRMARRILEIDRGRLFDWECDYDTFLIRKEALLSDEAKQNALFDKKLVEEERWIRQGIKARRTRNEGRVRALKKMREERAERRDRTKTARMKIQEAERSGALIADLDDVSFAYATESAGAQPTRPILQNFSCTIMRGDKIGIIGPNGAGKTTLLRLLLGQLQPNSGSVRLGTNQKVAYFDQLREQLDEDATVADNVGDGYDTVETPHGRRHLLGYLQDFLFTPERARTQVKFLSGGERHRILLAKMFAKPANILVLDEPTNDLDTETLELLEELLMDFSGTVLTVSHDREFLNQVVTSTLVFESGGVKEYVGGFDDWIRQSGADPLATFKSLARLDDKPTAGSASAGKAKKKEKSSSAKPKKSGSGTKRLSFKEHKELESLPTTIETLEAEIDQLHQLMADPAYYQSPGEQLATDQRRLTKLTQSLDDAYARWEQLEERSQ